MSKLQPLPKEVTDEIRFILEGCRDGRLEHKQTIVHCGTAHCIAGWKVVMDYRKAKRRKTFEHDSRVLTQFVDEKLGTDFESAWEYAERKWGLTDRESGFLFVGSATFPRQFALLEKLEAGKRIK